MSKQIYLDYAAATPSDSHVKKDIIAASKMFSNPSAIYQSSRDAKQLLDLARKDVARFLQTKPEEVIFTSGATESNNLAILGIGKTYKKGRIISTQLEHSSVLGPLQHLVDLGYEVVYCPVDKNGRVQLDEFSKLLSKDTILVTVSYANSEIGTIQPIIKLGQVIKKFNECEGTDIKFHTDASAAALLLPCDVSRLGVDLLSIGGSKIYGPQAVGALYVKRGTKIEPIMYGGNQELGLRPGSEPVDLALGLGKSLVLAIANRDRDRRHFDYLQAEFDSLIHAVNLVFEFNNQPKLGLPNIVNISLAGQNGEDLVARLDSEGIEVATGAACQATSEDPSRALLAIGLSRAQAQSSLRISFGRATTVADLKMLTGALSDIIQPQ